jgi:hypothetical protein
MFQPDPITPRGSRPAKRATSLRMRVRVPMIGWCDLVLHASNDNVDEVEHYIRTYLMPRPRFVPSRGDKER